MRLAELVAGVLAFATFQTIAQSVTPAESGVLVSFKGQVYVDGRGLEHSAALPTEIRENSLLRTGEGRAEVILTRGIVLRLGEKSSVRMVSNALGEPQIEILTGSAFVVADEILKDSRVTVVCEDAVTISNVGVYRFDANPAWWAPDKMCRLKTYKGVADVRLTTVNSLVRSGETINLSLECQDMIPTNGFDINDADQLDERTHYFRSGWIVDHRRRR